MSKKTIKLLEMEKKQLNGDREATRIVLLNKIVYEEAKNFEFTDNEKEELNFMTNNEKVKYYIANKIENKITEINEEEVTRIYTENKENFDAQGISFSGAREIIFNDLINQQVNYLENEEIYALINEMKKNVEITKEEVLFANGNGEILKGIIRNKIIFEKMKEEKFDKDHKEELEIIANNVMANFYLDVKVRTSITVEHKEVVDTYESEKEKINAPLNDDLYNQIANSLLYAKAGHKKSELVEEITKKYDIEKLVDENL